MLSRSFVEAFYAAFNGHQFDRAAEFTTDHRHQPREPLRASGRRRAENEPQIRTFVVVKRAERWLIMQDQNTIRR